MNQQPHQPSCCTLAALIEPQVGHHGGQAGSPHSWHKQRLLADLFDKEDTLLTVVSIKLFIILKEN